MQLKLRIIGSHNRSAILEKVLVLREKYSRNTQQKATPQCCCIRTHHDGPSQMHENLLLSRVKSQAMASVLAPLIKTFSCICEGHADYDGCVLYNDYHQNIEKNNRILIGRICHFRRCQIILWRNEMEPFDRAWFGCCPSGHIPSDGYGIPTCNSNKAAFLGFLKQQDVENRCEVMHQNGENACMSESP